MGGMIKSQRNFYYTTLYEQAGGEGGALTRMPVWCRERQP